MKIDDSEFDARPDWQKAVEYLAENPGDYAGAADVLGISRSQLIELRNKHFSEFAEAEERYVDKIEALCLKAAVGETVPENFRFTSAFRVLERLRSHKYSRAASKTASKDEEPKTSRDNTPREENGSGSRLLENYANKNGISLPSGDWRH